MLSYILFLSLFSFSVFIKRRAVVLPSVRPRVRLSQAWQKALSHNKNDDAILAGWLSPRGFAHALMSLTKDAWTGWLFINVLPREGLGECWRIECDLHCSRTVFVLCLDVFSSPGSP
jgi:hypothetical protein